MASGAASRPPGQAGLPAAPEFYLTQIPDEPIFWPTLKFQSKDHLLQVVKYIEDAQKCPNSNETLIDIEKADARHEVAYQIFFVAAVKFSSITKGCRKYDEGTARESRMHLLSNGKGSASLLKDAINEMRSWKLAFSKQIAVPSSTGPAGESVLSRSATLQSQRSNRISEEGSTDQDQEMVLEEGPDMTDMDTFDPHGDDEESACEGSVGGAEENCVLQAKDFQDFDTLWVILESYGWKQEKGLYFRPVLLECALNLQEEEGRHVFRDQQDVLLFCAYNSLPQVYKDDCGHERTLSLCLSEVSDSRKDGARRHNEYRWGHLWDLLRAHEWETLWGAGLSGEDVYVRPGTWESHPTKGSKLLDGFAFEHQKDGNHGQALIHNVHYFTSKDSVINFVRGNPPRVWLSDYRVAAAAASSPQRRSRSERKRKTAQSPPTRSIKSKTSIQSVQTPRRATISRAHITPDGSPESFAGPDAWKADKQAWWNEKDRFQNWWNRLRKFGWVQKGSKYYSPQNLSGLPINSFSRADLILFCELNSVIYPDNSIFKGIFDGRSVVRGWLDPKFLYEKTDFGWGSLWQMLSKSLLWELDYSKGFSYDGRFMRPGAGGGENHQLQEGVHWFRTKDDVKKWMRENPPSEWAKEVDFSHQRRSQEKCLRQAGHNSHSSEPARRLSASRRRGDVPSSGKAPGASTSPSFGARARTKVELRGQLRGQSIARKTGRSALRLSPMRSSSISAGSSLRPSESGDEAHGQGRSGSDEEQSGCEEERYGSDEKESEGEEEHPSPSRPSPRRSPRNQSGPVQNSPGEEEEGENLTASPASSNQTHRRSPRLHPDDDMWQSEVHELGKPVEKSPGIFSRTDVSPTTRRAAASSSAHAARALASEGEEEGENLTASPASSNQTHRRSPRLHPDDDMWQSEVREPGEPVEKSPGMFSRTDVSPTTRRAAASSSAHAARALASEEEEEGENLTASPASSNQTHRRSPRLHPDDTLRQSEVRELGKRAKKSPGMITDVSHTASRAAASSSGGAVSALASEEEEEGESLTASPATSNQTHRRSPRLHPDDNVQQSEVRELGERVQKSPGMFSRTDVSPTARRAAASSSADAARALAQENLQEQHHSSISSKQRGESPARPPPRRSPRISPDASPASSSSSSAAAKPRKASSRTSLNQKRPSAPDDASSPASSKSARSTRSRPSDNTSQQFTEDGPANDATLLMKGSEEARRHWLVSCGWFTAESSSLVRPGCGLGADWKRGWDYFDDDEELLSFLLMHRMLAVGGLDLENMLRENGWKEVGTSWVTPYGDAGLQDGLHESLDAAMRHIHCHPISSLHNNFGLELQWLRKCGWEEDGVTPEGSQRMSRGGETRTREDLHRLAYVDPSRVALPLSVSSRDMSCMDLVSDYAPRAPEDEQVDDEEDHFRIFGDESEVLLRFKLERLGWREQKSLCRRDEKGNPLLYWIIPGGQSEGKGKEGHDYIVGLENVRLSLAADWKREEILRAQEQLNLDWVPPLMIGREEEEGTLKQAILPKLRLSSGGSVCLVGSPGTGKTCAVAKLQETAEQDTSISLKVVRIRGTACKSATEVGQAILRDLQGAAPGGNDADVSRALQDALIVKKGAGNRRKTMVLLVIDEMDAIKNLTFRGGPKILDHLLFMARQPMTRLFVLGITNITDFCDKYLGSLGSRGVALPTTLVFRPYQPQQLVSMLRQRVQDLFHENALNMCATFASSVYSGDARILFNLCRESLNFALSEVETKVTPDQRGPSIVCVRHVTSAKKKLSSRVGRVEGIQSLPPKVRLVLCAAVMAGPDAQVGGIPRRSNSRSPPGRGNPRSPPQPSRPSASGASRVMSLGHLKTEFASILRRKNIEFESNEFEQGLDSLQDCGLVAFTAPSSKGRAKLGDATLVQVFVDSGVVRSSLEDDSMCISVLNGR